MDQVVDDELEETSADFSPIKLSAAAANAVYVRGVFALSLLDQILSALSDENQLPDFPINPRLPPELNQTWDDTTKLLQSQSSKIRVLNQDRQNWFKLMTAWKLPNPYAGEVQPDGYHYQSIVESLCQDLRTRKASATAYSNVACAALGLAFFYKYPQCSSDNWWYVFIQNRVSGVAY